MSNITEPASTHSVDLLTSDEVAAMLRLSGQRLRVMRSHGEGPTYVKLPTGGVRYHRQDVLDWIGGTNG